MQDKLYQLVKERLTLGQVIKNYKDLCSILNQGIKTGRSKILQLKDISRYVKLKKDKQQFTVVEIYKEPLPKIDGRENGNNRKEYKQFKISIENENKAGVYSIILNNDIYIGSTANSFRERFKEHTYKSNPLKHTYDMIHNGGIFEVIWIAEEGMDELTIRQKEKEYIQYYKTLADWNVINFKYISNKIKIVSKYKYIKVGKKDYNIAIKLLQENNIHIKLNKEEN